MNKEQGMVKDWHRRFAVLVHDSPTILDIPTRRLRLGLIAEEFQELGKAMVEEDIVEIADALADLLYVIYGTAVSYGLDLEPIFREVHASNMSKGDPQVLKRPDGKILKSANFKPPELALIIQEQGYLH